MLLDRCGDSHSGLRTRERDWTWDEVVRESAARGALASALRAAGPFHIGVLLDNVADFIFWLGGAALAGATIVGINPTRGPADMAVGATVCLTREFSASGFLPDVRFFGATFFTYVGKALASNAS